MIWTNTPEDYPPQEMEEDDDAYEQAQDAKRCEQEFERRFNEPHE